MKFKITFTILLITSVATLLSAQCDIRQRVMADGSLFSYVAPVLLYQTSVRTVQGGVMTDRENYFLELRVAPKITPTPDKAKLTLTLNNKQAYKLDMFDLRSSANDSALVMTFLMAKDKIGDFTNHEIEQIEILYDKQDSTDNIYTLKLHKALIKEHLTCLQSKK